MSAKVEYYVGNLHVPDEIPDVAEEVDDDAPLSEWDREALRVFAGYEEDSADDELPEYDEEDADFSEASAVPVRKDWITIGGKPAQHGGRSEQHHGGTPVEIDDSGKITHGPPALRGKPISRLGGKKKPGGDKTKPDKKPGKKPQTSTPKPDKKPDKKPTSTPKPADAPSSKVESEPEHVGKPVMLVGFDLPEEVVAHGRKQIGVLDTKQVAALKKYTDNAYKKLNARMRQCPPDFECVAGEDKEIMDGVESAIAAAPAFAKPVDLFRGLSLPPELADALIKKASEAAASGADYTLPSITSTSVVPKEAIYTFGDGLVFQIRARKGVYVDSVSSNAGEREVVLSAKSRYRVLGAKEDVKYQGYDPAPRIIKTIYLEQIA